MAEKAIVNGTSALRIITIEATEMPLEMKLRVAAYIKISSPSEDQKHSFDAQLRYYDALISGKENWTMVDLYVAEMVRRRAAKSPTKTAPIGFTSYASKYAFSERLVCREYETFYRRCTWKRSDKTRIVWRCVLLGLRQAAL